MLKTILGILKNKAEFLESAEMLLDNVRNEDLDSYIILGEATENDTPKEEDSKEDTVDVTDDKNEDSDTEEKSKDDKEDKSSEDINEPDPSVEKPTPIEDTEAPMNEEPPAGLDNPDPMSSLDSAPISKEEELQDIMQITIDLSTNNMTDVVPVTPPAASDAIVTDTLTPANNPDATNIDTKDSIMDTELDSSIGEPPTDTESKPVDDSDDLMNTSIEDTPIEDMPNEENSNEENPEDVTSKEENPEVKEEDVNEEDILEAVSFGADDSTEDTATEDTGDSASNDDTPPDKKNNEVTDAVLDKVAEADAPADTNDETSMEDISSSSGGDKSADLLKKLSDITNNIESTKKMIIDGLKK